MSNPKDTRIPVPFRRRMNRLLTGLGPVVVWLGVVALSYSLYRHEASVHTAQAVVLPSEVILAAAEQGRLTTLPASLFTSVRAGDPLAVFDDSPLRAERMVLEKTAQRIQAEIAATRARHEWEADNLLAGRQLELRRLERDLSQSHLEMLDRRVAIEISRIELQRTELELSRVQMLVERGAGQVAEFDNVRLSTESLRRSVEQNEISLTEAIEQLDQARRRLAEYSSVERLPLDIAPQTLPLESELEVLSAQVALLNFRLPGLVLRSPIDGVVSEILHMPGENVLAGAPVVRVTSPVSSRMVAYVSPISSFRPETGAEVGIMLDNGRREGTGVVTGLGARMELLPLSMQPPQNPNVTAFPVLITISEGLFTPGKIYNVMFKQ